jgi:pyruvate/2-oxoglutarate dehydrogenase complex dihydrolipoamide acyltransferase (E2) component
MPILIDMKKKPGVDAWEGQVYNAKDGQLYSSTIKPIGADQLEIQGCVLGFLCGGETWTRVGPPIPSSPANSMAKGAPKGPPGAQPKTAAPAPAPAAPKTTGAASSAPANPAPATAAAAPKAAPAQKQAAAQAGQPADIGDICLLPDIARFAH